MCRSGLRGFDAAYSYGAYEGVLRKLIHVYKYGRVRTLAGPLGEFLWAALGHKDRWDLVAAVPLHWRKRWQRGFNQSELLARPLAKRLGIPYGRLLKRVRWTQAQAGLSNTQRRRNIAAAFALRRTPVLSGNFAFSALSSSLHAEGKSPASDREVGQPKHRRWPRFFSVLSARPPRLRGENTAARGQRLEGKSVLLVDDVLTTGSTAAACARVLKRAGAARVGVLTVARADRRFDVPSAAPVGEANEEQWGVRV